MALDGKMVGMWALPLPEIDERLRRSEVVPKQEPIQEG